MAGEVEELAVVQFEVLGTGARRVSRMGFRRGLPGTLPAEQNMMFRKNYSIDDSNFFSRI